MKVQWASRPSPSSRLETNLQATLVAAPGDVQTEKFIALIQREPFDYTQWQRTLWPERSVEEISQAAMKQRRTEQSPEN